MLNMFQHLSLTSQNLVPNPSFENITQCPTGFSQIYLAVPWFQPSIHYGNITNSSSSDLLNTCELSNTEGVPNNALGYQFARTGNGYANIAEYNDLYNYREYLEIQLDSTLIANHHYCVEFYVSLANLSGNAISNMGVYFSNDSLLDTTFYHAIDYVIPQIENPSGNMLSDTANWMLISGTYVATGGEKFMTIGNFHNPQNSNADTLYGLYTNGIAYYYLDDVSVIDCTGVGVEENNKEDMVEVYPNPATNSITLTLTKGEGIVALYNVLGECVLTTSIANHKKEIDISFLPKGVYFVNVKSDTQSMNRKFVKE